MAPARARLRRDPVAWCLFVLVWFSCAWFGSNDWNPNNAVRLFAAVSIVEDGDATIDEFAALTGDKARFGRHYYSDKAPGMTLMAVPFVAIADAWRGERIDDYPLSFADAEGFGRYLRLRQRLVTAFVVSAFTAVAALLLYDLALGLTGSASAAVFGALAFALGTPAWGWSTTLFGHSTATSLLVIATWAVWRGTRDDPDRAPHAMAALAGAALGWALVVEFSTLVEALPIGLWALWRTRAWERRWPVLGVAVAAGTLALLPLALYNVAAFGTPFRLAYSGVEGFEGMRQGFFGLTYPKPDVLREILFGSYRGIVWLAPVVIAAPFGLWRWARGGRDRDLALLSVALTAIPFLYNASYFYWDGGYSTGPRHALPAVAFLGLGLAWLWSTTVSDATKLLLAELLALSVAINMMIASAEITAPDFHRNALWEAVIQARFWPGYLRTAADEWWGFTPWEGLAIWAGVAFALLAAILGLLARDERRSA